MLSTNVANRNRLYNSNKFIFYLTFFNGWVLFLTFDRFNFIQCNYINFLY